MLEEGRVEKPVYFRYLTLMSYHVFIQENIDVAIYEVGVGGEYDSTNIVDTPAVTGISHLGLDHTYTLGDTIDKIAWHKAGIQKESVPSFSVLQTFAAQMMIINRSQEKKVHSLRLLGVDPRLDDVCIEPHFEFQKFNASLAIALAGEVLSKIGILNWRYDFDTTRPLPEEFVKGLELVKWRGRCEEREDVDGDVTWYLDGAHTPDSMRVAAQWYNQASKNEYVFPPQSEYISDAA